MKIQLFNEDGKMPERKKKGDCGYDIYLPEDTILRPGMNVIDLKVGFEIPEGHMGLILPRSSSSKKGILTSNPPIDENYRGSVTGYILNSTGIALEYNKGDRLVQLVIFKIATPEIEEAVLDTNTERGTNKEGSSGQ